MIFIDRTSLHIEAIQLMETPMATSHLPTQTVEEAIDDWPRYSRTTAETLLEKYGEPDEATARRLVWHDNGPWKRTILPQPN